VARERCGVIAKPVTRLFLAGLVLVGLVAAIAGHVWAEALMASAPTTANEQTGQIARMGDHFVLPSQRLSVSALEGVGAILLLLGMAFAFRTPAIAAMAANEKQIGETLNWSRVKVAGYMNLVFVFASLFGTLAIVQLGSDLIKYLPVVLQ
jgi:hypothetical protein